jgi:hypothetical protein
MYRNKKNKVEVRINIEAKERKGETEAPTTGFG